MAELGKITPSQKILRRRPAQISEPRNLSPRAKAAVIVRLLLSQGAAPPIADLPEHLQASLTEQMGQMGLIDRTTLTSVVEEFIAEMEQVGLSFPGGIDGALSMMDGHISATAANRLRRLAGVSGRIDPWERLTHAPIERLVPMAEAESAEVAAVMLSKLPVARAAEILGHLPGEKARRIAYAVSLTADVDPETVHCIGNAILSQIDAQPIRAFELPPVKRVGAILNVAPARIRDDLLRGLDEDDADFAESVRKAIFTFVNIPERLALRDVARVIRNIEQADLVTLIAAGNSAETNPEVSATIDFLLANISQRLAESLREEAETHSPPRERQLEAAMSAIISAIRNLESSGEITLRQPPDEDLD